MPYCQTRLCAVLTPALLLLPAPAQTTYVVDPGGGGDCSTIGHALALARTGDRVHVRAGVYREALKIDGKALSIRSLATGPSAVVVLAPAGAPGLTITGHPVTGRSEIVGLELRGADPALVCRDNAGQIALDAVMVEGGAVLERHRGLFSWTDGLVSAGRDALVVSAVERLVMHGCTVRATPSRSLAPAVACRVVDSAVEFGRCTITGGAGGGSPAVDGGTAIEAHGATLRISGLPVDRVRGGDGVHVGSSSSLGGVGIRLHRSRLVHSGVSIEGGLGRLLGRTLQSPAIRRMDREAQSVLARPAIPVVAARSCTPGKTAFAVGGVTEIEITGAAYARSLTFVGLATRVQTTPFGDLFVDLTGVHGVVLRTHGTTGLAAIQVDLGRAPAGLVGMPFTLQSVVAAGPGEVLLSAPRIGFIHR